MRRIIFIICAITFSAFQVESLLAFKLLDDKLAIKGNIQQILNVRIHEDVRDVRYSTFRTTFRLEGLYDIVATPDLDVNFYSSIKYYYDEALDLDSNQRHAIRYEAGSNKYRNFRRPRNAEEWLNELYFDIKYKDFQIRLGKQLVSWGETAEAQVVDVINPVDLKYIMAFPDWEDFKLGLWMARMIFTPENMWQNLSFELIVIPFDFEETRLPPAGSGLFFGAPQMPDHLMQKLLDRQTRDAPKDGIDSFEIGLRIRGYTPVMEGIDWTISHFYTRLDTPLVDKEQGFRNMTRMFLGGGSKGRIYTYPHYNSTAATFSTTWNRIGADIRGECAYNTNRDYNYGTGPQESYKIKKKDLVTTAITISKPTMIPYISTRLFGNRSRTVDIKLTWYQYWLLNHEHDRATDEYVQWESGNRDSRWTKFSLELATGFFYDTLNPFVNISYDTNGPLTFIGGLMYMPGDHFIWMLIYQQYNEAGMMRYQNQVTFSVTYNFW